MVDRGAVDTTLDERLVWGIAQLESGVSEVEVPLSPRRINVLQINPFERRIFGAVFTKPGALQLPTETAIELTDIGQVGTTLVRDNLAVVTFQGEQEIVLRRRRILSQQVGVVVIIEHQFVHRELVAVRLAILERIFYLVVVLELMVSATVSQVAEPEPMATQVRRGQTAGTETESLHRVVAGRGVQRTIQETVLLERLLGQWNIPLEEPGQHHLAVLEEWPLTHGGEHRTHLIMTGFVVAGTMFLPEILPLLQHVVRLVVRGKPIEQHLRLGIGLREVELAVTHFALCIETRRFAHHGHLALKLLAHNDYRAVGQPFLFNEHVHVTHEVQVDVGRDAEVGFLEEIGAVGRYIEVSDETELLGHQRCKTEVDVPVAVVERQRVKDIELIESDGETRQRIDELVGKHVDIVVVQIDFGKTFRLRLGHQVTRQHLVQTHMTLALTDGASALRITLIEDGGQTLVARCRENGTARIGRINILVDVGELLFPTAIERTVEVVERIGGILITLTAIVIAFGQRVVVFVFDDLAYQFHRRIATAAIVFALGSDNDLRELVVVGNQHDNLLTALAAGRHLLGPISHTRSNQHTIAAQQQGVTAVRVGDGAIGGAFLLEGDELQSFARNAVTHITGKGDTLRALLSKKGKTE